VAGTTRLRHSQLAEDLLDELSGLVSSHSARDRDNPFNPLPKSVDRNARKLMVAWRGRIAKHHQFTPESPGYQ
jgi:hypothetical protein